MATQYHNTFPSHTASADSEATLDPGAKKALDVWRKERNQEDLPSEESGDWPRFEESDLEELKKVGVGYCLTMVIEK
jgi:hypothetical protein